MNCSSRRRLLLVVGLVALTVDFAANAQDKELHWNSQVIRLLQDDDRLRPPVVTAVSLQPGGGSLAIGGDDHLVRILDSETGRQIHRLEGHTDWVRSVAYSPDGQILATAGNDGRVIFWNAIDGQRLRVYANHGEVVTQLVFSHDGKQLAAAGFEEKLYIYEVPSGRQLHQLLCPCRDMRTMAFSPDDQLFAAGGRDGNIRIWSSENGSHVRDIEAHPRRRIRQLVFSHAGDQIISCGDDRRIRVSNVHTDEWFYLPECPTRSFTLTLYAPGRLATAGSDNMIHLWDLDSRREIGHLKGHSGSVAALASEGRMLVSGGYDTTIRIWKTPDDPTDVVGQPTGQWGSSQLKQLD